MVENMTQILNITNTDFPYPEIARALEPHKDKSRHSVEFWVEMDGNLPIVGLLYPGKKKKYRPPPKIMKWDNLYDFVVQPYSTGNRVDPAEFTFEKMLEDFAEHKSGSNQFWELLEELYDTNILSIIPPTLPGIESRLYLLVLKWIWIQEDLRYKYDWEDVESRIRYRRTSKKGNSLPKGGAGRAKFFAALVLLRNRLFTLDEVKKIIPPY
jgi:hypothetical protein